MTSKPFLFISNPFNTRSTRGNISITPESDEPGRLQLIEELAKPFVFQRSIPQLAYVFGLRI